MTRGDYVLHIVVCCRCGFLLFLFFPSFLTCLFLLPLFLCSSAVFQLSMRVQAHLTVLFNSPLMRVVPEDNGLAVFEFEETVPMSTYLVAIYIGEIENTVTHYSRRRTPVTVYVPVGNKRLGDFTSRIAAQALDFYEEYFGIDYPMRKLDLVAPEAFLYGGMEVNRTTDLRFCFTYTFLS